MKNKCWKPLLRLRKTSYQRGKVQTLKSLGKNEINSFIQFAALHVRIRIYFSVALCDFQLRGSGLGVAICLFNSSISTRWHNSYNYRTFDFSNRVPYNSRFKWLWHLQICFLCFLRMFWYVYKEMNMPRL